MLSLGAAFVYTTESNNTVMGEKVLTSFTQYQKFYSTKY